MAMENQFLPRYLREQYPAPIGVKFRTITSKDYVELVFEADPERE